MTSRIIRCLTAALVVAAAIAPTAGAHYGAAPDQGQGPHQGQQAHYGAGPYQDQRPYQEQRSLEQRLDGRHAALAAKLGDSKDLRSPDARDAGLASEARDYTDLRSPDARVAGRTPYSYRLATPNSGPGQTDGRDADIIAAGVVGLMLVGGVVLFRRRSGVVGKSRRPVASS